MQAYMSIFGQEGIGRPDLDVANEVSALKKYLSKQMDEGEIPEIQAVLIFTNDEAEVDAPDSPAPVLKAKQLKDFLRQRAKDRTVEQPMIERIKLILAGQEATGERSR